MSERRRFHIPDHVLGGRVRTTTLSLCLLWVGLWLLYVYLNPEDEQSAAAPPGAVVVSDVPYVPYVPEPTTVEPTPVEPVPTTTAPTTTEPTPTTTGPTPTGPGSTPGGRGSEAVPGAPAPTTTTTQPGLRLPEIPIPGLGNSSPTEPTGESVP
ncbi:hypothetical protein [Rhodococcus indonesiensis]|uniref:hypothetical protein n=1 Tax=Rhodococcus indonesiensis TaxID=3055869 RepID=UPI0039F6F0A7